MTNYKLNIGGGKLFNRSQGKLSSFKGFMGNQNNANVTRTGLRNLQQRLTITETSADIAGTVTSIAINTTGFAIIKNADKLIIVNPVTGVGTDVNVTADVKGSDVSISVASVVIYAPAGSFVMFQEEFLNYFVRGGTITTKKLISNADYKTLNTSPVTLVTGVTGLVMIPVNLLIITDSYSTDDESNNIILYCGHGTSTTAGQYWDNILSFNYRLRKNTTWNMTGDTGKIYDSSIAGQAINLYSNLAFESDDFTLKVYLTYRIDSA